MKVSNVYPGTPAQRAGLQVGDVIFSINGYLTEQRGNLAWIIANAAPNNQLNMTVKTLKRRPGAHDHRPASSDRGDRRGPGRRACAIRRRRSAGGGRLRAPVERQDHHRQDDRG